VNQRHPSHRTTGIMSLPYANGGRAVQRFQQGGFSWGQAFNFVRGLISDAVPHIASSLVTVGLPALIMGASPKDALKYSAATGIASLAGQKFSGATTPRAASQQQQVAAQTPEEVKAAMTKAGVVPLEEGPAQYDETGTYIGPGYTQEQIDTFTAQKGKGSALTPVGDQRGFFESMWDVGTEPDKLGSLKQAFLPDTRAFQDKKDYIRQYGPLLGLGIGSLWASGQFDPPKPEPRPDPWGGQTWQGLMQANPAAYRSAPTFVPRGQHGGLAQSYPRRNGSINGPGTGTSDEIPAMLSDGEFVMTADAVRGAGNGSRKHGMRRMYDMMQNFEGAS